MDNKTWIMFCILVGFVCFMVGINWNEMFMPKHNLSDEQIYQELLKEYEYYMKIGGMWDKKVSDVPVHINNHKDRIFFEINRFKEIACNGTY